MKVLIEDGNAKLDYGELMNDVGCALNWAININFIEGVKLLIDHNANVLSTYRNKKGKITLELAEATVNYEIRNIIEHARNRVLIVGFRSVQC